jgi:LPS-assembly protein
VTGCSGTPARWAFGIGCLLLAATASAQVNFSGLVGTVSSALLKQGTTNTPGVSQNPREPTGFPPLPSKDDFPLPPPRDYGTDERVMRIEESGETSGVGNHVHVEHGFHIRFRGYDVYGDALDGERDTEIFTATGNVRLVGVDQTIRGEKITIDFHNKSYHAYKAEADLKPSFFPLGTVIDDVYVTGEDSEGSGRELFGQDIKFTTCNLPDPHFYFIARSSDLRPGKRLILRHVTVVLLHKKLLTIPYLSIPLDDRKNHIIPEVGDDPTAGYYIKTWIPIALHGDNQTLTARLDYYSKLGVGTGLEYDYANRLVNGILAIYGIFGQSNEQDLNIQHQEHFGKATLNIGAQYANNDYLQSPGTQLLNLNTQLTIPQGTRAVDQISYSQSTNNGFGANSNQETATLNDTRTWNPRLRTNLTLGYTASSSSFGGYSDSSYNSSMMDVNFEADQDLKRATAELQYMRNIPIGSSQSSFFGLEDEAPVITLRSDSPRLLGQKLGSEYPFTTDLSFGNFGVPSFFGSSLPSIWRTNFDFNYTKPDDPNKRFDWSGDARFTQGMYSDDTAQYVQGTDLSTRYNLGRDTAFNMHYSYLEQHGYTPLTQDVTGQSNLLTSDLSFRPIRSLILAAQTGYDFMSYQEGTNPWQSLGLRAEWRPLSNFQFRTLATYTSTLGSLSTVQCDLAFKPGATFLSAGFRYDALQHTIGEWDLFVDALKWGRMKLSMVLDYDGYAHTFTADHFSITYDLHCAEAIFQVLDNPTGFRSGTQLAFFIRLKAFPFDTPFGVGNSGQAVGAGFGRTTF